MNHWIKTLAFASLFVIQQPVQAKQNLEEHPKTYEVNEIVITATLSEKPVSEIPASIEVITEAEIQEIGARTLTDVLFEAQSTTLEPTNGRLSVARLRGLSSKNTLILIDGVRQPSGFQDYVDLGEIPVGMIQQIEVVRGSSSALYGSEAIGGVINIITKNPSHEFISNFNARYGQSTYADANTWLFNANNLGTLGTLGYSVSGTFNGKDRYDRDISDLMTDGDDKTTLSGSAKLTFPISSVLNANFGLTYSDIEHKGIRTQTAGDFNRKVNTRRLSGFLELQGTLTENLELMAHAHRSTYNWESEMAPITTGSYSSSSLEQQTHQFDGRLVSVLFNRHRITAGLEYRNIKREDQSASYDVNNIGVFIQDETEFFKQLGFIAGLRYDHHSDFGSAFSPKLSAYYRLNEIFRMKGSYSEGFRAPSVYELYTGSLYTKKKILYANPDLNPEKSRTYELGVEAHLTGYHFGITAFRNDLRDMIGEIQTGTQEDGKKTIPVFELRNIEEATTQGVELNAEAILPFGLSLSDALTVMDTENKITGSELLYVPRVSNLFKIAYHNNQIGLKGNIRLITTGKQTIENEDSSESYTLIHIYTAKQLSPYLEIYLGINNLFNSEAGSAYGNIGGSGAIGTFFYSGLNLSL